MDEVTYPEVTCPICRYASCLESALPAAMHHHRIAVAVYSLSPGPHVSTAPSVCHLRMKGIRPRAPSVGQTCACPISENRRTRYKASITVAGCAIHQLAKVRLVWPMVTTHATSTIGNSSAPFVHRLPRPSIANRHAIAMGGRQVRKNGIDTLPS